MTLRGVWVLGMALLATPAEPQTLITPDDFLEAAVGKTLSFHEMSSGELVGKEQFLNRSLSVWKRPGEQCVYGQISTRHGQICFLYDNDVDGLPVCWWPFLNGDQLMVRSSILIGAETQEVRSITTETISCPNAPLS